MELEYVVEALNTYFNAPGCEPDSSFAGNMRATYAPFPGLLQRYATAQFLTKYNGLMLRNGAEITKVYTVVFLSQEVLDKILSYGHKDTLVVTHHPLEMETSHRGFLPMPESYFKALKAKATSVYSLHDPLDVHSIISTSRALASALGVTSQRPFAHMPPGFVGIYGCIELSPLPNFLQQVRVVTRVPELHYIVKQSNIEKVGIVAGEVDASAMQEAESLGCDTYLTGTYYNRINNPLGEQQRISFKKAMRQAHMNLIECSHYASESIVMKRDLFDYLAKGIGLAAEFVEQSNPWY